MKKKQSSMKEAMKEMSEAGMLPEGEMTKVKKGGNKVARPKKC